MWIYKIIGMRFCTITPPQDGAPNIDTNLWFKPKKGLSTQRVWDSIEYGWSPPLILDAEGRSTGGLKPKHEWDIYQLNLNLRID